MLGDVVEVSPSGGTFSKYFSRLRSNGLAVNEMSLGERLELAEANSWDLVAYILSLRTETTTTEAVLGTVGSID